MTFKYPATSPAAYEGAKMAEQTPFAYYSPSKQGEELEVFPAEEATAEEVRAYIANVLTSSHGFDIKRANEVASCWSIGTGRELRTFPPRLFSEIFGGPTGWILYKETRLRLAKETAAVDGVPDPNAKYIIAAYMLAGELILGIAYYYLPRLRTAAVLVGLVVLVLIAAILASDTDPVAKAEKELHEIYKAPNKA